MLDEHQRKREELLSELSFLKASISGKQKELELRKQSMFNNAQKLKEIEKEIRTSQKKITDLKKETASNEKELASEEETIKTKGKEIEKLHNGLKDLELQLQQVAELRGSKRIEMDRLSKELTNLEIRKATVKTRLEDMTHEYDQYREVEKLSHSKDQLTKILEESESVLKTLGNVNMASIDMYVKKKEEIGEIEGKLEKLNSERDAILRMMDELEVHKKDAFFETFDAVAENFKSMFKHLHIGQGIIYLDKPASPFESGLHIKLQRGNKEHTLDSLSGGENSLIALMFIFAMQFFKPSPFYILDEVDAALDKENSKNLSQLILSMSKNTQFLVVTHNDTLMNSADSVLGVTKSDGISKIVGVKLSPAKAA